MTSTDGPPQLRRLVSIPTYRDHPSTRPAPIRGVDAWGGPVTFDPVSRGDWALLLFLSTGCDGCADVWRASGDGEEAIDFEVSSVVIVTPGEEHEDAAIVRERAPRGVLTVMSDEAWSTYRVFGPPFFVLVDGAGAEVVTEGVIVSPREVVEYVRWAKRKVLARSGVPGRHGPVRDHPKFSPGSR